MSLEPQPSAEPEEKGGFRAWLLPSWLSIDSPIVVVTWTWAFSRALDRPASREVYLAIFLACWSVYLLDRLIDVARCQDWSLVSGRMRFGRQFRSLFGLLLLSCLVAAALLFRGGQITEIAQRGVWVGVGVLGYGLLFVVPVVSRRKWPGKEFAVGLFSALAILAALPSETALTVSQGIAFCAFAAVVSLNCLVIAARDRELDQINDSAGASQWWRQIQRDLPIWGIPGMVLCGVAAWILPVTGFFLAVALSFGTLLLLHRRAVHCSADAVRALADLCLLTPWLLIFWS